MECGLTLGGLELLGLGSSTDTSSESSERDDLLVLLDVGEVGVGFLEVHSCRFSTTFHRMIWRRTAESSSNLSHVFEMRSDVFSSRFSI